MSDTDDQQLVARCRGGDKEAFAALVDRHKDKIYWLVRRIAGQAEAEDLTQEVFLRAYVALAQFRGEASFRTWLCRIAHNLSMTHLAKRSARGGEESFDDECPEDLAQGAGQPAGELELQIQQSEFNCMVHNCLDRLPAHFRSVLTLRYLNEVSYDGIAEITGLPLGTVKAHIHRGLRRLRQLVLAEISPGKAAVR